MLKKDSMDFLYFFSLSMDLVRKSKHNLLNFRCKCNLGLIGNRCDKSNGFLIYKNTSLCILDLKQLLIFDSLFKFRRHYKYIAKTRTMRLLSLITFMITLILSTKSYSCMLLIFKSY